MSAQTIDKFQNYILQIEALPSGSVFTLTITEEELTAVTDELLVRYNTDVQDMLQDALGVRLTISNPKITLRNSGITLDAKAGKGFLKVNASLDASVNWDGNTLRVNVQSLDLPIVQVDPSTVTPFLQSWITGWVNYLKQYYEIRSFDVTEGKIQIEVLKK